MVLHWVLTLDPQVNECLQSQDKILSQRFQAQFVLTVQKMAVVTHIRRNVRRSLR